MRINKYLAQCELGSRRSVEQLIVSGKISVNGKIVRDLSTQIEPGDKVLANNKPVSLQQNKIYIILNKPKGYLCSAVSQNGKPSVLELVKVPEKIYPVGRLDFNTEGLLLLTNDGDFTNQVIHPKNKINKTYSVVVKGKPTDQQLQALRAPMVIDDYTTSPAIVKNVKRNSDNTTKFELVIHEGRNRQIRKMMEQVRLQVLQLKRVQVGNLKLNDLQVGQFAMLQESDLKKIFK